MIRYLILLFVLIFSHFSFATELNKNQLIETCPSEKPIVGYIECYSCTDKRSLNYHYPEPKVSEWGNEEEFYKYIHEHYKNSYRKHKESCKGICPNRIEYCGFGWLGEGDCFCELDNFKNRINALFYSNALEFLFGGWILFIFYFITFVRFLYTRKFWKNKLCKICISISLPVAILFVWGLIFIGKYIFTLMALTILIGWILQKVKK